MSSGYAAAEREAYRGVRRACDAGLDSTTLRVELTRRITGLIPAEARYFGAVDARTGLLETLVGETGTDAFERQFFDVVYPLADAGRTVDLARSGRVASTSSSGAMTDAMHSAGLGRELRVAFALGDMPTGMFLAFRERSSRAFGEHDVAFVRRIAPHVARALRRAALVDAARVARLEDLESGEGQAGDLMPGVVVIDDHWRVAHWTAAAEAQLADLADATAATAAPTSAIVDFIARQRSAGGVSFLSLQGCSGHWYTLRAALTEPDELGRSSTVVIIKPARRERSDALRRPSHRPDRGRLEGGTSLFSRM